MPSSCYHAILKQHKISSRSFLSLDITAETKFQLNCKIFVGRKILLHLKSTSCLQLTAGRSLLLILSCSAGMCCLFKEFQFQSISIKGSSPINHANVSVGLQIKGQISQFTGSRCRLKLQNLSFFFSQTCLANANVRWGVSQLWVSALVRRASLWESRNTRAAALFVTLRDQNKYICRVSFLFLIRVQTIMSS